MIAYLLGLITIPAFVGLARLTFWTWFTVEDWMKRRHGITFSAKTGRNVAGIDDYTLRTNIWWERQFGPIFIGGWYREAPRYEAPAVPMATRWLGLGPPDGPCLMVLKKRLL